MKPKPHPLSQWLPRRLLLYVLLPYTLLAAALFLLPARELWQKRCADYERVMARNSSCIEAHLSCVSGLVTLLRDSTPVRETLLALQGHTDPIPPQDLYYNVSAPVSYRNLLANHAVSAVTVYSEGRLALYSLQQTTTDLALSRCGAMLYSCGTAEFPAGGACYSPVPSNGYVYFICDYTDLYEGRLLGQIVIELESIPLYDNTVAAERYHYQLDLTAYPGTQYYVYDTSGRIFFSNQQHAVGLLLEQVLPETLLSGNRIADDPADYLTYSYKLYKPTLTATLVTPRRAVLSGIQPLALLLLAAGGGLLLAVLLLLLGKRITTPFQLLAQSCQGAAPAAPPASSPLFSEAEAVRSALNARTAQVEELQAAVLKYQLKMKDHELQLLQSQISPHFLFNMLDIIGWQAAQDQNSGISEMITHLGGLLRSNILLNRQEKISIRQEVQYVRDYLALEQIRCSGSFSWSIDADEDLLDNCRIPKLSIQPLVENCVVHGFRGLDRPGSIELRIWDDTDGIRCLVRDNGVGFDAEGYLDRTPEQPPDEKRSRIALHNIQQRIRMLCGPGYGLEIQSTPGAGTEVMLTLPFDETAAKGDGYGVQGADC